MNLLLDTHVLIWWATDDAKLSQKDRQFLADPDHELYLSSVCLWEVAIKFGKGMLKIPPDLLRNRSLAAGFKSLQFTDLHAIEVARLPPVHQDPFDRALIAQAIAEPICLVTRDERLRGYAAPIRFLNE